ncbi:MAG TPA: hypothetical protein VGF46_00685 [Gaiellales bacterium]|jgi:hypothetical protein
MTQPTRTELHRDHLERSNRLAERTSTAWAEYLAMTRASAPEVYAETESFAWRRLRRDLAAIAQERRRVEFELDRGLIDLLGTRRAA